MPCRSVSVSVSFVWMRFVRALCSRHDAFAFSFCLLGSQSAKCVQGHRRENAFCSCFL